MFPPSVRYPCFSLLFMMLALGACKTSLDGPEELAIGEYGTIVNFDEAGHRLSRFDAEGNALDAHGGEVAFFDGRFYLYGESYGCGFGWKQKGTPFCGFKVYSSPDLIHWNDRGFLFDFSTREWQERCDGSTYGCFRPHVVYNDSTGKYVLWINTYDVAVGFRVFEADSPVGLFVERPIPRLAVNSDKEVWINNGDEDLFVDNDGTAYLVYTDWRRDGDLVVEELTPDYLSGTGEFTRLRLRRVEAPSLFRNGSRYYVTFSDPNCGYCTTGTSVVSAPTPMGPWSPAVRISSNSCGGQPGHVSRLPTANGGAWYLYQSDLWNNSEPNEASADLFWAPLSFDSKGSIRPVKCAAVVSAPLRGAPIPPPAALAERYRLACDIGTQGGRIERELRFVAGEAKHLKAISVVLFQKGGADAPLELEVLTSSRAVRAVEVPPEEVSWSPRRITLPVNMSLERGRSYSVRLHGNLRRGCYGVAYRSDIQRGPLTSFVRLQPSGKWVAASERYVALNLILD